MRIRPLLALVISLALTGCASLDAKYVRDDRQTFDAFGPFVARTQDVGLTDAYAAWKDRLESAERLIAATPR
jgi:hypothetical protein